MLTIQKRVAHRLFLLSVLAVLTLLPACTQPGPRALLDGERLIREGRFPEAVARLETATQLLPKNAQAWNHLGLAYHGGGQPEMALRAYRQALTLDHKLTAARYNLGCLHLEQTNLTAAVEELTSFTMVHPNSVEGWTKLGAAHWRARRIDAAEKAFRTALDLQPRHAEALNQLGLIQLSRRRFNESLGSFNLALTHNSNYAPALLNSAVVAQQYLNNRSLALQRYRQYLAVQPRPADGDAVEAIVRQFEAESGALALRAVTNTAPLPTGARTNPPVSSALASAKPSLGSPPNPATARTTNLGSASSTLARSNPATLSAAVRPIQTAANFPAPTPPVLVPPVVIDPPKPVAVEPTLPPPPTTRVSDEPRPEVTVVSLPADIPVRPAQSRSVSLPVSSPAMPSNLAVTVSNPAPPLAIAASPSSTETTSASQSQEPEIEAGTRERRGFFRRLNPFAGRARERDDAAATAATPTGPGARYAYLSPAAPTAGSRADAEPIFKRAVRAHQSGRKEEAMAEYQSVTRLDPTYFEAYFNQALAATDMGRHQQALAAYEHALALQPDSADTRFNFALALKRAGYHQDAAAELEKLLRKDPRETRVHLALGNLYAQQLNLPERATEHYLRVIDLEPRHPEAQRIRYWLGRGARGE